MIGATLRKLVRPSVVQQARKMSGFPKPPVFRVKPLGIDGNVMIGIGAVVLVITTIMVQSTGYLWPQTTGVGFDYKKVKIDLHERD